MTNMSSCGHLWRTCQTFLSRGSWALGLSCWVGHLLESVLNTSTRILGGIWGHFGDVLKTAYFFRLVIARCILRPFHRRLHLKMTRGDDASYAQHRAPRRSRVPITYSPTHPSLGVPPRVYHFHLAYPGPLRPSSGPMSVIIPPTPHVSSSPVPPPLGIFLLGTTFLMHIVSCLLAC